MHNNPSIVFTKALILLFLFFQFMATTWAMNNTFLDSEAEAMNTRVWCELDINESLVRKSLNFIENKDEVGQYRYDNFQDFVQESENSIKNQHFILFSEVCQKIYKTSDDESTRIAVNIFFQEVTKKYTPYYVLQTEMRNTYGKVKNPPKKSCDFQGINFESKKDYVIQNLSNSLQISFLNLSKCKLSSKLFNHLTMELNLKEFHQLKFIDISGNPNIDRTAALALGEWLSLDSQPYIKLTQTDLKTKKIENLYDELRKTFTKNQTSEFMKRVIFLTRNYLTQPQVQNNQIVVYIRLVQEGKIPPNWREIHLEFYRDGFLKDLIKERKKNIAVKEQK